MSKVRKSDVKSVKALLGLFGYAVERKVLKRLAGEKRKNFRSLLKEVKNYGPVNFQSRTTKIFFFVGQEVHLMADSQDLLITEDVGKEVKKKVAELSQVYGLEGSFENCLFQLITNADIPLLEPSTNTEPIKFCRCVLVDDSTERAFIPVKQSGLDAVLGDFGWRCVFACLGPEDGVPYLKKRIFSLDNQIREFLGLAPPIPSPVPILPISPDVPVQKKEEEEEDMVLDITRKADEMENLQVLCCQREFTTFAEGLEWFSKIDLNSFVVSQ